MLSKRLSALALVTLFVTGCAVQQDITLDPAYWQATGQSVGIVMAKQPKPTGHKMGNQGLLDMAINEGVASGPDKHLESLSLAEFDEAAALLKSRFEKAGRKVTLIEEPLDIASLPKAAQAKTGYARKDFVSLRPTYNVDQLLVLEVVAAGTVRSYYGFMPLGDPQAYFVTRATLVDLADNRLLWLKNDTQQLPITKPWDQPDENFVNMTNAFYQAVEAGKVALVQAAGN